MTRMTLTKRGRDLLTGVYMLTVLIPLSALLWLCMTAVAA